MAGCRNPLCRCREPDGDGTCASCRLFDCGTSRCGFRQEKSVEKHSGCHKVDEKHAKGKKDRHFVQTGHCSWGGRLCQWTYPQGCSSSRRSYTIAGTELLCRGNQQDLGTESGQ